MKGSLGDDGGVGGLRGRLVEREKELAALAAALGSAQNGRGRTILIEGEAGLGKSSLLYSTRAAAERAGMRVLLARGSELERGYAFGVARQLLPGSPVIGAQADSLARILALYDEVLGMIRAEESGVSLLVAIDDLHWADEPSLHFLAHLALRIEDQPIVLVGAVRSGEPGVPEEVLQKLREAHIATVLSPRPLSADAVASMVRSALGEADDDLVDACRHATGGNPFYLSELLRAVGSEDEAIEAARVSKIAPPAVMRSVLVRLGRLGHHAAALARAAVILGDAAPIRLASALSGLDEPAAEAAADTLARAGILQRGEPLRFVHPLIASALEADMGAFERARQHRRAAELLLAEAAPDEVVAGHLLFARPTGDQGAVDLLQRAAARAIDSGSPAGAIQILKRALSEPASPDRESGLWLALAKAETLTGSQAAAAALEEALARIKSAEERVDALIEAATVAHLGWDFPRAAELAARAASEPGLDDPRREELLGIELSAAALHPDMIASFKERLEPILTRARAGAPPADKRLLGLVIGQVAIEDPTDLARGLVEMAIADDPLIDGSHGASIGWAAAALEWIDELELADRWLTAAIEAARERGDVLAGSIAASNRARARYFQGRLDLSVRDATAALEIYHYGWISSPWSTPVKAMSQVAIGDFDAARDTLALGRDAGTQGPDYGQLLEADARLHLAEGDAMRALESARAAGASVEGRFGVLQPRIWEWRRLAALAAHRLGNDDEARSLVEPDLQVLRRIGPARQLGAALTVAGIVHGGATEVELLSEAASVLERSPARLQRTETLIELGAALRRAGKRTAAKKPLYEALEAAADMGASPLEQRARDELARLGLRPRRTAQSGVASLTPSELQVARLAADGLTTPQIAGQLHVSRNTVETHLKHVYQKLGVPGRTALRDALSEPVIS